MIFKQLRMFMKSAQSMLRSEKNFFLRKNLIRALPTSPERINIPNRMRKYQKRNLKTLRNFKKILPYFDSIMKNMFLSYESVDENPVPPKTQIDPPALKVFESEALKLDILAVGYMKLPPSLIFKDMGVLYDNAIVLTYPMKKEKIALAPSLETGLEVFKAYNQLGINVNKLTEYLRDQGFSAQGNHPLGGISLFPALGQMAGLGWHGRHGLLISPQNGPCQRIAAIYTSIENLPSPPHNEYEWIGIFCETCGNCIRTCPQGAIFEEPKFHENSIITHIDDEKCFPLFSRTYGCSVCIKECLFTKHDYQALKTKFEKRNFTPKNKEEK